MNAKKEFGDFQTSEDLATRVVALVDKLFGTPDVVIEPTVGLGAFLKASAKKWESHPEYRGYEINEEYVDLARKSLSSFAVQILHRDFFAEDWTCNLAWTGKTRILIIGNPPWVTNSELGQLGSRNLPKKMNSYGLSGLDARTGKSNFDIAEWMLVRLIEALPSDGAIAMLCKTVTARKVLRHFWKAEGGLEGSKLFHINAKVEFGVAVDACLFFTTGKRISECSATVYSGLDTASAAKQIGFIGGNLVSNIDAYQAHKNLDRGSSIYSWRSGVKHDAAKVMEFTRNGNKLINGFGETVDIENEYVYPLLKSSDIGNGRITVRKAVLVTQRHPSGDTSEIEQNAPKTWEYLMCYSHVLDRRKSSIYKNRPRFSIFGIGSYSFSPWKVAISGLYKNISFVVVPPWEERSVMLDDTCYSIPCHSCDEATFLCELLSTSVAHEFLRSLVFADSKRPITIDILKRLSFVELARCLGKLDELQKFVYSKLETAEGVVTQMSLLLTEPRQKYQVQQCRQGVVAR